MAMLAKHLVEHQETVHIKLRDHCFCSGWWSQRFPRAKQYSRAAFVCSSRWPWRRDLLGRRKWPRFGRQVRTRRLTLTSFNIICMRQIKDYISWPQHINTTEKEAAELLYIYFFQSTLLTLSFECKKEILQETLAWTRTFQTLTFWEW